MKEAYKCPIDGCGANLQRLDLTFTLKVSTEVRLKLSQNLNQNLLLKRKKLLRLRSKKNLKKSAYPLQNMKSRLKKVSKLWKRE